MLTLEFRAMNTTVLLAAKDGPGVSDALQNARAFIADAERRFSRFISDSELSRLNGSAGGWVIVSRDLMEMLVLSLRYHQATRGLFDPSVLPDLVRAGYDRSMDEIRAVRSDRATATRESPVASETEIAFSRENRPAFSEIKLDADRLQVHLPIGVAIDLGGIAKGWIVQKTADLLSARSTPCAVSAGGDMFFVGLPEDGTRWTVELEDPLDPNRTIARLSAGPGAMVTSAVTKRTWGTESVRKHHIIDPRSGVPAKTEWLSATVFAPQAAAAEAYAKALLVGGTDEALRIGQGHPELAFVAIDQKGALHGSPNSRELISGNVSVQFVS